MKIIDIILTSATIENSAIMAVDFQEVFCNPTYTSSGANEFTDHAAANMKKACSSFNRVSLPIIWVKTDDRPMISGTSLESHSTDDQITSFYKVSPNQKSDIVIPKTNQSAFDGFYALTAKNTIINLNIENLFICGVSIPECVIQTIISALNLVQNVYLVTDLSASSNPKEMQGKKAPCPLSSILDIDLHDFLDQQQLTDVGLVSSKQIVRHFTPHV